MSMFLLKGKKEIALVNSAVKIKPDICNNKRVCTKSFGFIYLKKETPYILIVGKQNQ